MRSWLALALLLALLPLAAPSAAAAAGLDFGAVAEGDDDEDASIVAGNAGVSFIDADGDNRPDLASPEEPLYVDVDGSNTVTYGDVRLTRFGDLGAASPVGVTAPDIGRVLMDPPGWFTRQGTGWIFDTDNSLTITAGDLRFDGGVPQRIGAGGPGIGQALTALAGPRTLFTSDAAVYVAPQAFGGASRVAPGDFRMRAAVADEDASPAVEVDDEAGDGGDGGDDRVTADEGADGGGGGVRGLDILLLVLAGANLAGLGYLLRSRRGPPRNPFK